MQRHCAPEQQLLLILSHIWWKHKCRVVPAVILADQLLSERECHMLLQTWIALMDDFPLALKYIHTINGLPAELDSRHYCTSAPVMALISLRHVSRENMTDPNKSLWLAYWRSSSWYDSIGVSSIVTEIWDWPNSKHALFISEHLLNVNGMLQNYVINREIGWRRLRAHWQLQISKPRTCCEQDQSLPKRKLCGGFHISFDEPLWW